MKTEKNKEAAKHTPGPWVAKYDYNDFGYDPLKDDWNVYIGNGKVNLFSAWLYTPEETKYNALLISAAPELLEALREVALAFGPEDNPAVNEYWESRAEEHMETGKSSDSMRGEVLERVRAAIAKAEGKGS